MEMMERLVIKRAKKQATKEAIARASGGSGKYENYTQNSTYATVLQQDFPLKKAVHNPSKNPSNDLSSPTFNAHNSLHKNPTAKNNLQKSEITATNHLNTQTIKQTQNPSEDGGWTLVTRKRRVRKPPTINEVHGKFDQTHRDLLRQGKCFKCLQKGHRRSACKALRKCFKCGSISHVLRHCTVLNQSNKSDTIVNKGEQETQINKEQQEAQINEKEQQTQINDGIKQDEGNPSIKEGHQNLFNTTTHTQSTKPLPSQNLSMDPRNNWQFAEMMDPEIIQNRPNELRVYLPPRIGLHEVNRFLDKSAVVMVGPHYNDRYLAHRLASRLARIFNRPSREFPVESIDPTLGDYLVIFPTSRMRDHAVAMGVLNLGVNVEVQLIEWSSQLDTTYEPTTQKARIKLHSLSLQYWNRHDLETIVAGFGTLLRIATCFVNGNYETLRLLVAVHDPANIPMNLLVSEDPNGSYVQVEIEGWMNRGVPMQQPVMADGPGGGPQDGQDGQQNGNPEQGPQQPQGGDEQQQPPAEQPEEQPVQQEEAPAIEPNGENRVQFWEKGDKNPDLDSRRPLELMVQKMVVLETPFQSPTGQVLHGLQGTINNLMNVLAVNRLLILNHALQSVSMQGIIAGVNGVNGIIFVPFQRMDFHSSQGAHNLLRMQGMENEGFVGFNAHFNMHQVGNETNLNFNQQISAIKELDGGLKDQHMGLDANFLMGEAPPGFENGAGYKTGDPAIFLGQHAETLLNEAQSYFHIGLGSNSNKRMENPAAISESNYHTPTRRSPRLSNKHKGAYVSAIDKARIVQGYQQKDATSLNSVKKKARVVKEPDMEYLKSFDPLTEIHAEAVVNTAGVSLDDELKEKIRVAVLDESGGQQASLTAV